MKRETARNEELKDEDARLVKVSKEYDSMEQYTQQQVMYAQSEVSKMKDEKETASNEQVQLKTAAANYQAQAKADLQALEQALGDSKRKNVETRRIFKRSGSRLRSCSSGKLNSSRTWTESQTPGINSTDRRSRWNASSSTWRRLPRSSRSHFRSLRTRINRSRTRAGRRVRSTGRWL